MYNYFNFFNNAMQFIENHPNAKLVGWGYGININKYIVFLPNNENENKPRWQKNQQSSG
jgi:hypothetical protein